MPENTHVSIPKWLQNLLPIVWWTCLLYGFFMILYPFLIGCGCPYYEPHTCGIKAYLAPIGTVVCMVCWTVGIRLYRRRENMLVLHALLTMLSAFSALVLLLSTFLIHYIPLSADVELVFAMICCVPLLPYMGLLTIWGTGNRFLVLVLLYTLVNVALVIRRYRILRRD